ncbi:hypothetical protein RAD16_10165 [Bradyrhizobium sp. 18BD]
MTIAPFFSNCTREAYEELAVVLAASLLAKDLSLLCNFESDFVKSAFACAK